MEAKKMTREEFERDLDRRERAIITSRQQNGKRGNPRPEGIPLPALRMCRVYEDMTMVELAEKSGVTRQTIARLESGRGGATRKTIRKLARALDKEPRTLFDDPLGERDDGS